MEVLKVLFIPKDRIAHCPSKHVECARIYVNYWSSCDANFRLDKVALHIACWNSRKASFLVEKTNVPERHVIRPCRIERVHTVMLSGDEEHVMLALAWDLDRRNEQRLRVDRSVHLEGTKFAELARVDVSCLQVSSIQ